MQDKDGKELEPGDIVIVRIKLNDSVLSKMSEWASGSIVGSEPPNLITFHHTQVQKEEQ